MPSLSSAQIKAFSNHQKSRAATTEFPLNLACPILTLMYEKISSDKELKSKSKALHSLSKLCVCAEAMEFVCDKRETRKMHEWIVRTLTENYKGTQSEEVDYGVIYELMRNKDAGELPFFREVMSRWLSMFYYYCRSMSALHDIATKLSTAALYFIRENLLGKNFTNSSTALLLQYHSWTITAKPQELEAITAIVEKFAEDPDVPRYLRAQACTSLCTKAGMQYSKGTRPWAEFPIENHINDLQIIHRLQVLAALWSKDSPEKTNKLLIDTIKLYSKNHLSIGSPRDRIINKETSSILQVILNKLLKENKEHLINQCLSSWYKTPEKGLIKEVLFFSAFSEEGLLVGHKGKSKTFKRDNQKSLIELTESGNLFNQTSFTVTGNESNNFHIPERMGIPDKKNSEAFEKALSEFYTPNGLSEFLEHHCPDAKSQVIFPTKNYPIQAIQIKNLGVTWPFTTSLKKPKRDQTIKRVAVWMGAGSMTEEIEAEAVVSAFQGDGISVDLFTGKDNSLSDFLNLYKSSKYQVIWLSSHGEFDHLKSHSAEIQISYSGEYLKLEDLLPLSSMINHQGDSRRLLVLNVCDGSSSPGNSVLPFLGMAPGLASPSQACISNLWPVEGLCAATFGSLLAISLANRKGYFEAFHTAVDTMLNDSHDLLSIIKSSSIRSTEIVSRLVNSTPTFSSLESYGAPSFYE